jgi:DNA topoisomerase-1
MDDMERDAQRLYELIWRQFVACQMVPAKFTSTSLVVAAEEYELRTRGRIMLFDGFLRAQPSASTKEDDIELPDVSKGEVLDLKELKPIQHFTKPTARYSEAALVKELEKQGIGRPSTYAAIISTIQDRGYARLENRRFYAEKMGDIVTDRLNENFANLMNYDFTATMEESLDTVAAGEADWKDLLTNFYKGFVKQLDDAGAEEGGMRPNDPTLTDIACPDCERPMTIRTAGTGVFLGCSGYALPPKERCKCTVNLVSGDEAVSVDADEEAESRLLITKHRCEKCNLAMDSYLIDENRKLHVCGNNPDCLGFEVEQGKFKIKGYEGPVLECDKCTQDMQLKTGRFGKYFGCTSDSCKNTRKLLKSGEAAPPKMDPVPMPDLACRKVEDHYILRDGAAGLFLAASKYPKNRETRSPQLAEILPYKDQIDNKYNFIFKGPTKDPDGNAVVIRFSRKTKEHYLTSEVDGKTTSWRLYYRKAKWQIES